MQYLAGPSSKASRKIKLQSMQYMIYGNALYKRGGDSLLLECLGPIGALTAMAEVHECIFGAHQPGVKMRWLLRRYSYYWPTILKDCIEYAKGCQACQKHGTIRYVPIIDLHAVVKPWPFRGWAMDMMRKIHPPSSKHHCFILVATDYFTKWVEAKPYKAVDQTEAIGFIKD